MTTQEILDFVKEEYDVNNEEHKLLLQKYFEEEIQKVWDETDSLFPSNEDKLEKWLKLF